MDFINENLFDIDSAFKFRSGEKYPLQELKDKLAHVSIVTLEYFLSKHNPNMDQFSLNDLSLKLGKNCTTYTHISSGDEQVSSEHIKEKICKHFTISTNEFKKRDNKDYDSIFCDKSDGIVIPEELRKYKIYLAYDDRDITSYAAEKTKNTIRDFTCRRN